MGRVQLWAVYGFCVLHVRETDQALLFCHIDSARYDHGLVPLAISGSLARFRIACPCKVLPLIVTLDRRQNAPQTISGALAGILVRERAAPSCPIFKLASAEFDLAIWSIRGVLLRTEKIEVLF